MMEMSPSIAMRYILELLKAGDKGGAMAALEEMIPQAVEWEREMNEQRPQLREGSEK